MHQENIDEIPRKYIKIPILDGKSKNTVEATLKKEEIKKNKKQKNRFSILGKFLQKTKLVAS